MLSLLKVKNLALVDELEWHLNTGLIAVTGETGAGKSVIVGALKLVLGERADKGLIRTGESSCVVEAVFDLVNVPLFNAVLRDSGLEPCEEGQLIIKRVIGQSVAGPKISHEDKLWLIKEQERIEREKRLTSNDF